MLYGVIRIFENNHRSRRPQSEVLGDLLIDMHASSAVRIARLREHGTNNLDSEIPALHHVRIRRMDDCFTVLVGREGSIVGPRQAWSCRYITRNEYHARTVFHGMESADIYAQFEHWWQDVLRIYAGRIVLVNELRKALTLPDDLLWQLLEWADSSYRATLEGPDHALSMRIHGAEERLQQIEIKRRLGYGDPQPRHNVDFTNLR